MNPPGTLPIGERGNGKAPALEAALLSVAGLHVRSVPTRTAQPRILVREASFDLARGESLGIVGESGSGKSLTARSIAGLLPAGLQAGGAVRFAGQELLGRDQRSWRELRGTRMSLLLQDPFTMLNPLQTAGAHIAESLRLSRRRGRERKDAVAERLDEVGLAPDVAGRYPFQLSGGMRQRVALAAALAGDPELLIADEPTTALDVTTQAEVLSLLAELRRSRGMSLILITHDLRVAFSVCDRILVMYAGSMLEQAPAPELRSAPAHPYTLGLLTADPPSTHYVQELTSIPGSVPQADSVTTCCPFSARCNWVRPECTTAAPALRPVGEERFSACIRVAEIRGEMAAELGALSASGEAPPATATVRPILTVTDLRKTFRSHNLVGRSRASTALDGVSLEIGEGESLGLVGETGSGKTTVARSVLGLVQPDSGRIAVAGLEAGDFRRLGRRGRRELRRTVQVVFQDPYSSLNPALTIGATLSEVIGMRGDAADPEQEVEELLGQVGLPAAYAERRPSALSGGERQRIAIARAIALRPKLLICDEPVAALDVSAQAQVLELLREIRRRSGMSMVFITHDLSVVRQMTERIVVLYRGKIVESGETATVLDQPGHAYTRRLLAAVPGRPDGVR
ncbi:MULTISPECIES: ABC transporter ATP-binding protein [Amycolatopsis]|uniref:dipeptide ABC transporter ATP-binding protein n=1 Tax=Amycolatopsis TaxID=1813 RepID=UPI0007DEE223|nr:ABC transporter ATP-binding protein [Amycolatopsis sp. M39]OAP23956.1 putative D,D-dipeptide transport ATP-binding protein DdpD [Amycolatopsis sp. M39]